jgi:hypothetical protein
MPFSGDCSKDRPSSRRRSLPNILFTLLTLYTVLLLCCCGRKGPPTLASYERLPAPTLTGAYHREGAVRIFWSYPKDKENMTRAFTLLRATDETFLKLASVKAGERSYIDTDFKPGEHYRYKILARNLRGILSSDSNILNVTPLAPPLPPEDISFIVTGDSVVLSWQSRGKNVRYNVYKGFRKGMYPPSPMNASPLSEDSFRDALDIDKTVYYVVRSVVQSDLTNEGASSEQVVVDPFTFVPSAPKGLRAFAAPDRVILYWDAPTEPWVTGFRVYRRAGMGAYALIGSTQIPTFVDREMAPGKRDYEVTAVGPEKEGPGAEIRDVTFPPQE